MIKNQIGYWLLLLSFLTLSFTRVEAQSLHEKGFYADENLTYEVRFKWGLINGRAGVANFRTKNLNSHGQWFRELTFRSTGIFDTIYPMRDTLSTLYDAKAIPLRWEKRADEGNYFSVDELQYVYTTNHTAIRSKRYTPNEVKIDTVLNASSSDIVLDMLAVYGFLRSTHFLDKASFKKRSRVQNVLIPVGRKLVKCKITYAGKDEISTAWGGPQTECYLYRLAIQDDAFTDKNNMDVWVTTDNFRVPAKVQAKLKIGYAVCTLMSHPHIKN